MSKSDKSKVKKILSIICTVLTVIIFALAAAFIINTIYCRARNKPVSFFGTSFAVVQSPSMEPEIMTGDLIVYHSCKFEELKVGDDIVFVAGDGFAYLKGQSIVHRVHEITENGLRTKGVNNLVPDVDLVTADNLLGICTGHSAVWGKIFTAMSKFGIFIIIGLIAVPFIVTQIIKIVKLSRQNKVEDDNDVSDGDNSSENV